MAVAEASLKNLQKWKRGHKPPKSPGRPRKRAWVEDLEALASQPQERLAFLRRILRKHPVDAMHYLAGKPLEQLRIEASLALSVEPATIELAAAAAKSLMDASRIAQDASQNRPLSLPSTEIKTPVIES